ncbi:BTAD domain-containing putative transcriptional regulator [Saccharothrix australiensis]|uniref:DNA-binding SARP family transcriptional activator n=1 Tax=Saccharothrix australiensis TaxID=2072 RepID=A0A495VZP8_9PSEU|nr:BTAD domain-containing putative transcriptional regulator [Saccharothrix australiensis]RKT53855.1 DNA-binding SARP family transcriptional activator [Saccharothrix australiensis]
MHFRVLGPLEAEGAGRRAQLGGGRQRATLGLLLLHANKAVATSTLLDGLWGKDNAPPTARKVLQNAVRGLRVVFAENQRAGGSPTLLTRSPGYLLRVEPERIDLFQFEQLAEQGRAELAAGRTRAAAKILRSALALWRGPALADLVEAGYGWAELTAVQNLRLDVLEDYFEAELANGRHLAVLAKLTEVAEAEPLRERLSHQLMLALYRSGRQADALSVYRRVRSALVERLGLEPGRDLRLLQHAILAHDPALLAAGSGAGRAGAAPPRPEGPVHLLPRPVAPSRVSAILIGVEVGAGLRHVVDGVLADVVTAVTQEVALFGGTLTQSMGTMSLAVFPDEPDRVDCAERAVRAAVAVRDRLCYPTTPHSARHVLRVAVATGEPPADRPSALDIGGALLVECESLVLSADANEIAVCDRTRAVIGSPQGGRHGVPFGGPARRIGPPAADRGPELDVLDSVLERARGCGRPHLVSVLGAPRTGKSWLLAAFERRAARTAVGLRLPDRRFTAAATARLRRDVLFACCHVAPEDGPVTARDKLHRAVLHAVRDRHTAIRLSARLRAFTDVVDAVGGALDDGDEALVEDWWELVAALLCRRPLAVLVDDLHLADDALCDFVGELLGPPRPVPLLVVTAADPGLFLRRPEWGAGRPHVTTVTLDPVADGTAALLPGDGHLEDRRTAATRVS